MKQYGLIDPTYYVALDPTYYVAFSIIHMIFLFIVGRQIKISDSNEGMRPQPWLPVIKTRQEKSILKEKKNWFFFIRFLKTT